MTDIDPSASWSGPHAFLEPIAIPDDWPAHATTTFLAIVTAPVP